MKQVQKGFTLIELVIVLVILGILAAVAVPKFEDMAADAKTAAIGGGVSSVGSAFAIYTAKNKAAPTGTQVAGQLPGSACTSGVVKIGPGGAGTSNILVTLADTGGNQTTCASAMNSVGTGAWTSA